jgi:hypothetical protein
VKVAEVVIVALVFIGIGMLAGWRIGLRSSATRPKEVKQANQARDLARAQRNLAADAMGKIEDLARRDASLSIVESALVMQINDVLRDYAKKRRELE